MEDFRVVTVGLVERDGDRKVYEVGGVDAKGEARIDWRRGGWGIYHRGHGERNGEGTEEK